VRARNVSPPDQPGRHQDLAIARGQALVGPSLRIRLKSDRFCGEANQVGGGRWFLQQVIFPE
jgi:hypothetical protein